MIKHLLFCLITTFSCQLAISQSISSNSPLCTDNLPTLELKASGGSTYAWSGPNSFTSNQQNPTISKATASNAGTYTCVVDGKTSLTVGVKVGKFPYTWYISNYVDNASLRIYTYINENNYFNSELFSYSWKGPNGFTSSKYDNTITGIDKNSQGIYALDVKDEFGCNSATSTRIQFANPECPFNPYVIVKSATSSVKLSGTANSPYLINACEGSNLTVNTDTTGWGRTIIQWYKDGKIIPNSNGLTLDINSEGIYYMILVKGNCSYNSYKIQVKYNAPVPYISAYNNNKSGSSICKEGGYTNLYASNSNSYFVDNDSYQWYKDGRALANKTRSLQASEEGIYQIKIKAGQCEGLSNPFVVKKVDKITSILSYNNESNAPKILRLCSNNLSYVSIKAGGDGSNILYKNGQVFTSFSGSGTYDITQQPGIYVLQTTQGTCITKDTLKLEYGKTTNLPVISFNYASTCSRPIQSYHYLGFSSNLSSTNLRWEKDGNTYTTGSSYIYPDISGVYQAKYNDPSTNCVGESEKVKVTVTPNSERKIFKIVGSKKIQLCKNIKAFTTIQLDIQLGGNNANAIWKKDGKIISIGNNQIIVSEAGKYWYEYNAGQCILYSDTAEVTLVELPKITLSQTCDKNNTVRLVTGGVSGAKYNWYKDGKVLSSIKDTVFTTNQGGKFVVEAFSNVCYNTSNEVNVGVSIPEITNICNGDSLKLKAISDASNTYSWTGPNNFKSNLQNPVVAKTNKSIQGLYKLSATDKAGCTFTAQTQVSVNDYPAFTLPKTITACAGSDFVFNQLVSKPLTDSTETVNSYYFTASNKNTYYGGFYLKNVSSQNAGIYNATVTGFGGCIVKTTMELIVDASNACKSISISNYSEKSICAEQTIEIPFKTTGIFKTGTNFRAYYEEGYYTPDDRYKTRKVVLGTGTKSPIKASGLKSGRSYEIKVESEDGIASVGNQYVYTNYVGYNYITDKSGDSLSSGCTSLPLSLGYGNTYGNQQWFLNGDTLKKETTRNVIATKSGKYTFVGIESSGCQASFSKDVIIGKLDKPQVYNNYINELSCFNESVYLSVIEYPNTKYTWKRDGILQTEKTSFINATTTGKYTVEISKETCKATSDTIVVKQKSDKIFNLSAGTYQNYDNNKELKTYIYTNGLGNSIYKYQLFKNNQLFEEGKQNQIIIKDVGKYFFKVSKGDCEAVSNVIDYKGINGTTNTSEKRNLYLSGSYDYLINTVQLCDTNTVRAFYGYPYGIESNTVVNRKLTAYRDDKPLPSYKDGADIYPSLRPNSNDYDSFYLYFRGAGTYYVTEEVTLKDSTKLKFRHGDMTVQVSSLINLGSKTPQNIFSCADSTLLYGNTYTQNQRPIGYIWKKDGVVVKKITNPNESSSLSVKQPGTYVLETTYKGGCVASATPLKVQINKMDVIVTDVPSLEICDGSSVVLYSYIYGLPFSYSDSAKIDTTKIFYQLLKDEKEQSKGFVFSGYQGSAYIPLSLKEAGTYILKTQQGKCQGTSNDIILKTINVPNSINYVDSVSFCQTQTVNLKTTEDATLSYLWERDGGFIKDANKATLEVKEAGIYRSLNRKGSCWNYTPKVRAKILANILPTAILTGDKEINYADTAKVSIAFTSHAPWTFKLSDGKDYTATKSPFEVSLRPQFSTNYTLTEVKNVCGAGAISGTANIKVLVLSSELEQGIYLNVFPVPSKEDVNIQLVLDKPEAMEWTLNNTFGNVLMSESQPNKRSKHESIVSLKTLPEGVYFLRIQAGEKSLVRKIIKSN